MKKTFGISFVLVVTFYVLLSRHGLLRHQPATEEHHPFEMLDDIWTAEELESLRQFWASVPEFHTVREDVTSALAHMGEMTDALPDGSCPHQYLIPRWLQVTAKASSSSSNHSEGEQAVEKVLKCVLPERIDVAHHHFKSGGIAGRKEKFEDMVSRLMIFHKIFHEQRDELSRHPAVMRLFQSDKYKQAAQQMCPGMPVLDRIQLGVIVLVPGQEVGTHFDVPWFAGATRYDFPQWLLVVMERSRLFDHLLWPQVQGVAYIHHRPVTGGSFFFWPDGVQGAAQSLPAIPNRGVVLDGSIVAHGVDPFGPLEAPPPPLNQLHAYSLRPSQQQPDAWHIWQDDRNMTLGHAYPTEDLRVSLVWRARCFRSQEEKQSWHAAPKLRLDDILDTLKADLRSRGVLSPFQEPAPLELALMLLNTYVHYPYSPSATIPYNYCMLPRLFPSLSPLVSLFCS